MTTKWFNTEEASVYLKQRGLPVEPKTLRNWRAVGKGPRWHYLGAKPLASTEDLEAYAETALQPESPVRRKMREREARKARLSIGATLPPNEALS